MRFYVYILECSDGTYYTGNTSNLEFRLSQYQVGKNPASYTYRRRPIRVVWVQEYPTRHEALGAERQIKGWSHAKKKALIEYDFEKIHQIVKQERKRRERINEDSNL